MHSILRIHVKKLCIGENERAFGSFARAKIFSKKLLSL